MFIAEINNEFWKIFAYEKIALTFSYSRTRKLLFFITDIVIKQKNNIL